MDSPSPLGEGFFLCNLPIDLSRAPMDVALGIRDNVQFQQIFDWIFCVFCHLAFSPIGGILNHVKGRYLKRKNKKIKKSA